MLEWLNKQGVKNASKGFIVQVISRFLIEYKEELKTLSVEVEPGFLPGDKVCITISSSGFDKWDDGGLISQEKKIEIMRNFKDAMEFQDVEVIVE